jgi:hypothetical protein
VGEHRRSGLIAMPSDASREETRMNNAIMFALAGISVAGLVWWYRRLRDNDRMTEALAQSDPSAMVSSRAQLIDGANHIAVALSLDPSRITYRNSDLDASIDINKIDEVEYGSDLVTGGIADGAVLRLRAHGRAIEFVLDAASAERWSQHLPPHRMNETGSVHAV